MQSAIAKDGRPIRIHVPDPSPKCPQCDQLYTDDDEYAKPELVVPMKWRSFNDSKKLSTEAELVKVPAATECYRCWDVRRCEEFRDMDAATVKSKRENPEFDEQWTERRRAKATGSEKYSTQRKAKANAVETKKGLFAEDFNEGITYSLENFLELHAADVQFDSVKEKMKYVQEVLGQEVTRGEDGTLEVDVSTLPSLAKKKFRRGTQQSKQKVSHEELVDEDEADDVIEDAAADAVARRRLCGKQSLPSGAVAAKVPAKVLSSARHDLATEHSGSVKQDPSVSSMVRAPGAGAGKLSVADDVGRARSTSPGGGRSRSLRRDSELPLQEQGERQRVPSPVGSLKSSKSELPSEKKPVPRNLRAKMNVDELLEVCGKVLRETREDFSVNKFTLRTGSGRSQCWDSCRRQVVRTKTQQTSNAPLTKISSRHEPPLDTSSSRHEQQ